MSSKIIFITGGARSGKSSFALNEASRLKGQKAYIATAEALDSEMRARIKKHKKDRGNDWNTYEEPLKIVSVMSGIKDKYSVVIIDCLTVWLSNIIASAPSKQPAGRQNTDNRTQTVEKSIQDFIEELETFKNSSIVNRQSLMLYVVSNEVGLGIVPDNELARSFRDLAGALNQKVAATADEAYLVTAGIPIKIK